MPSIFNNQIYIFITFYYLIGFEKLKRIKAIMHYK